MIKNGRGKKSHYNWLIYLVQRHWRYKL